MKPKQEDPKEMVGGCCVCSDENGWTENPLVYCDGQGCNVAVHQACYGIVTVPTGSWFCRKCESQERAARVRCELCPAKDGALKRTDSGGWAHVVCALYIPEVRFGNVTTMEPIMLQLIPPERFNKICYICEESSKGNAKSQMGACMQCNRQGCKNNFHVTCAQAHGLLCEEAGNYLDNVKYCGYCSYHYNKLLTTFSKRGSHVKTIPPYRPVPPEQNSSDEDKNASSNSSQVVDSSIKEHPVNDEVTNDSESKDSKHKKRSSKYSASFDQSKQLNRDLKSAHSDSSRSSKPSSSTNISESSEEHSAISDFKSSAVPPISGASATKAESKAHSEQSYSDNSVNPKSISPSVVKLSLNNSSVSPDTSPVSVVTTTTTSSTITASESIVVSSGSVTSTTSQSSCLTPHSSSSSVTSTESKTTSISTIVNSSTRNKIINSLPISSTSQESNQTIAPDNIMDKEKEKQRKLRRNGTKCTLNKEAEGDARMSTEEESPCKDQALTICEEKNLSVEVKLPKMKTASEEPKLNVQFTANVSSQLRNENFSVTNSDSGPGEPLKRSRSNSQDRGRRNKRGSGSSGSFKRGRTLSRDQKNSRDSGASSPDSFTSETIPVSKRARAKKTETKESLSSVITNGVGANTLLLGNQINPSSAMAQKMADTLNAELEAHSIYKDEEKIVANLVGPALPCKRETSTPGSVLNSSQPPPLPQSLEQLLERQWEQGSQFLMEQAQHFDIASLLSCLHQLRQENVRLEETVNSLVTRRDHLLAVNARLSVPLASNPQSTSVSQLSAVAATTASSSMISITPTGLPSTPVSAPPPIGNSHMNQPVMSGSSRNHSHGRHATGGVVHSSMPQPPSGRGSSPHDRKVGGHHQGGGPIENGLSETEYRYRSPGSDHQHRQQSPMLPPGAQPSPTSMRQSPASVSYHSGSSPHTGVPSLSPSSGNHPQMPPHSMVSPHGHPPIMVSSSHRAPSDHSRAELVRLSSSQPNPNYPPVYQMVSPPVPHHSPVTMSQHQPPHSQVMRRETMESGRNSHSTLEKR